MTHWIRKGATLLLLAVPGATLAELGSSLGPDIRPETRPEGLRMAATASAVPRPVLRPVGLQDVRMQQVATSDTGFRNWIAEFRSRAVAAGIRKATLDAAFAGVQYDRSVIKLDRNQSEFNKQIWDYLDTAVSSTRVANGRKAMARNSAALDRIEAQYGVDKAVVTAIWGLESAFGAARGNNPLIASLATLAYDGRRGPFFEEQLIAALKIVQSGDVAPRAMTGSWAGAMGHTQFMPTSYLTHAVDFTGDGRRDLWSDDPTDALASTAAYLKHFGWIKGQPWGVEVRLPKGFDLVRARRSLTRSPAAWADEGIRDVQGRAVPNYGKAAILLPAGASGAAFMIFDNFAVIERYNKADAYVIGVGHLSDRLKGGPAIQAVWPRQHRAISSSQRKEIQRRLQRKGFAVEKIDGIIGPNTIDAIRAFQKSAGLSADGFPTQDLLTALGG